MSFFECPKLEENHRSPSRLRTPAGLWATHRLTFSSIPTNGGASEHRMNLYLFVREIPAASQSQIHMSACVSCRCSWVFIKSRYVWGPDFGLRLSLTSFPNNECQGMNGEIGIVF